MVTGPTALRCVIVDDNLHFLDAASNFLERQGVMVVDVASNGDEAIRCVTLLRPDVVLVDIDLGEESGIELAGRIQQDIPTAPPVILISTHAENDFADVVATSAAVGFVAKSNLSSDAITDILERRISP
jgi:DNA-binding NarL/FixJ family response regulator